jgi:hypothetical protein
VGQGFILNDQEANDLLADGSADYRDVVRPYLDSDDITEDPEQQARRWIIDFGSRSLEAARAYPAALAIVRAKVKPERELNPDRGFQQYWWRFGRPRIGMRRALAPLARYGAVGRHGKRFALTWVDQRTMASDATCVFAFDDDFSMGVLQSQAHIAWAWARSSTLETRLRYTPTSVFATFAWPDRATAEQREDVAVACRQMLARRSEICLAESIGLTALYNEIDEGGYADLKALHRRLNVAVADCYGWPKAVAHDDAEIVSRLTELNRLISSGERKYAPFSYLEG